MVCHSLGGLCLPKAVTLGYKQFFDGTCERLLRYIENKFDRLITAMPAKHAAGIRYIMTATISQLSLCGEGNRLGEDLSNAIKWFKPTITIRFFQSYTSLASLVLLETFKPSEFASPESFITQVIQRIGCI